VKASALVRLAWLSLRADPRGALLNGAAACAGAAALVFFVALGLGVGTAARALFPGDARLVEVTPSNVALGAVLGGGQLDDDAVARLGALPGAEAAWPKLSLRVPIAAARAPEGLNVNWPPSLVLQLPCVGVPRALLAADLAPGAPFEDGGEAAPIPIVLSRRLLEVYNRTIAPAWNVRRLPPGPALVGIQLPVRVGFSIVPLKTEDRVYESRLLLAGLSDRVPLYAAALPLEAVRRLHREYGKKDAGYTSVALLARRPDDVPAVAAAARRMGFAVDEGERATAERVGTAVAVTTGALALLALLMCALAALAIAQSLLASVRARAKEIAVLEAVGAAPPDVRALLVVEAALTGLAGGLAGTAIARAAALLADLAMRRALPDFPLKPETVFAFPPWLLALGVAVAVLSAVLGALAPAAAAARIDPARSLS
jgi:putative ABC transport system permease protein